MKKTFTVTIESEGKDSNFVTDSAIRQAIMNNPFFGNNKNVSEVSVAEVTDSKVDQNKPGRTVPEDAQLLF